MNRIHSHSAIILAAAVTAAFPVAIASAEEHSTDPAAMAGAKAVIAEALRPAAAPATETNGRDRFLLAVRALEDRQVQLRGAVDPADWLAAVDLALAVETDAKRTVPAHEGPSNGNDIAPSVRARLEALLSVLPGPDDWAELASGLRERMEREGEAAQETDAKGSDGDGAAAESKAARTPDERRVLLSALRVAVDFLAEGGHGAPESLDTFAALPLPAHLDKSRVGKAVAALRRSMETPGERHRRPFSAEDLMRRIERLRAGMTYHGTLPKEIESLSDEEFKPIAALLLAPPKDGDDGTSWFWRIDLDSLSTNTLARLAAEAISMPSPGGFAWRILVKMQPGPDAYALFHALNERNDYLGEIRKRVSASRSGQAGDGEDSDDDDSPDVIDDMEEIDVFSPAASERIFTWRDAATPMGQYAQALCRLLSATLDADRLADAEALAAPLGPEDWPAVDQLATQQGHGLRMDRPTPAWREFIEAHLPEGEELLRSPFLPLYAESCPPNEEEGFNATCARLLGDAAESDKATTVLKPFRLGFAFASGNLDALEADFLEKTDPAAGAVPRDCDIAPWCKALEALGETNRLGRALDRVLALSAASGPDGGAPVWAIPILARAGRFADVESVARAAMAGQAAKMRSEEHARYGIYRRSGGDAAPLALMRAYLLAGRPEDALDLATGWPWWDSPALTVASIRYGTNQGHGRESLPATVALALVRVGGDANLSAAASIARAALGGSAMGHDWPYEILIDTIPGEEFRALMDDLSKIDRYEERPWQWKAESLRRAGDLEAAENAARRALEIDPTDGEAPAGDRIRSYSILASVLEGKGGEAAAKEAATLRSVVAAVRAAEKGDELSSWDFLSAAIERYDEAAGLFQDAYCVQWRLAERLRKAGREAEAVAHYEETFRHMPAQFGQVASLCFGCEGVFSSSESVGAAERILPALAAAPGAGASVHHLLGMLRAHQERYDEAFDAFSRALEIDPGHFDSLEAMLDMRGKVDRPAADWARLQSQARRLDPFLRHHSEEPSEIVDWPGLWRAWDEAAAEAPAPRDDPDGPIFRFEAAARIREAGAAARRSAEAAIGIETEAGEEAEAWDDDGYVRYAWRTRDEFLPARMLAETKGRSRFWASRLVQLASALAGDRRGDPRNIGYYNSSAAFYDLEDGDDYFWDED